MSRQESSNEEHLEHEISDIKHQLNHKATNGVTQWAKILTPLLIAVVGAAVAIGQSMLMSKTAIESSKANTEAIYELKTDVELLRSRIEKSAE